MKRKKPELRDFKILVPQETVETVEYVINAESHEDALRVFLRCPGIAEPQGSWSGGELGLYTVREVGKNKVKKFRTKK